MQETEIGEDQKPVASGGRTPLEMVDNRAYTVVVRGLGEYSGGAEKDFKTGEKTGKPIRNVELVVCDPDEGDPENEYAISKVATTIAGKSLGEYFGERDSSNVLQLNQDFQNKMFKIGWRTFGNDGGRTGYQRLYVEEVEMSAKAKKIPYPVIPALVGIEQRKEWEGIEEEKDGGVEI